MVNVRDDGVIIAVVAVTAVAVVFVVVAAAAAVGCVSNVPDVRRVAEETLVEMDMSFFASTFWAY